MYTSEIYAAIIARDVQERSAHDPLLEYQVYDRRAEANAAAIAAGHTPGHSDWVAQFWYGDRHELVSSGQNNAALVRTVQKY